MYILSRNLFKKLKMKRKAVQGWIAFFIVVILLTEKQNGVIVLLIRKQK
ncbi:hypothetical protein bcere0024_060300 [Bacillus cereus Rock4-18]|nr:hypothetical protein bcere0024_060300 [Bacillus cereus Rock4-18]